MKSEISEGGKISYRRYRVSGIIADDLPRRKKAVSQRIDDYRELDRHPRLVAGQARGSSSQIRMDKRTGRNKDTIPPWFVRSSHPRLHSRERAITDRLIGPAGCHGVVRI